MLVAPALLSACDNLPPLKRDQCGNSIIERGEDCDGAGIGQNVCDQLCRLECTAQGACPAGWGCGSDGLCRQPTGFFVLDGSSLPAPADRLAVADIDGDGGNDVIASRSGDVTIAFAGEAGGLAPETTHIAFSSADAFPDVPSVGDVDGDGGADLVVRIGNAIGVLRGQADRTLTPRAFTRRLAIPAGELTLVAGNYDSRPQSPGDEVFALGETGLTVAHSSNDADFPSGPLLGWPAGNPMFLGNYNGIAYAFEGEGEIHLFRPIATDPMTGKPAWNTGGALALSYTAELPDGAVVTSALLGSASLAWQDDQGSSGTASALFVGGEAGGQGRLYMAFALGGGVNSAPFVDATGMVDDTFVEVGRNGPAGAADTPLLLLDLDGDTGPDLLTRRGYFTTSCPVPGTDTEACTLAFTAEPPQPPIAFDYELAEAADPGDAWTAAASVGSGLSDVSASYYDILVTTQKPGFLLLRNLGDPGKRKTFRVSTGGAVSHFVTGDFNGDGSRDIVFSQPSPRAVPDGPALEAVYVAWGDALGLPTVPVDLGDVGEVTQILSASLFPSKKSPLVPEGDGVRDFVVRARLDGEPVTYVFAGSTDRQIQSPLDLVGACTDGGPSPVGVPRFLALLDRPGEVVSEIAVVYREQLADDTFTYNLWSFFPDSNDTESICSSLLGPTPLPDPGGDALTILPVDLDGDGSSEVLLFAQGSSKLLVGRLVGDQWEIESLDLGAPYTGISTESIFSAGTQDLSDVVLWSDTAVTVLMNDGSGALDPASAATVTLQNAACPGVSAGTEPITGVTAVHLRPDTGRELVILTEQSVYVAEIADAAAGTLAAPQCAPLLLEGGGGGTSIASGDIDADGVEDLVISRPGGIQMLAGSPVVP